MTNSIVTPTHRTLPASIKVPEIITVYFWVIKLLTTAMGEATSDYLVHVLDPVKAVFIGGIALSIALILQFSVRRYVAWIYWLAVMMVAIFGTMAADVLHVGLGIPYVVSSACFAVALAFIFMAWNASEKTLSFHSIYTPRRELFYWATVMATFALGTAAGDMTATTLRLGYLASSVMFAVFISVPALAYWRFGMNEIFAFWFAYVLTRPLGASFADWLGKPPSAGGFGLAGPTSLGLTILIVILVGYLTVTRKDIKADQE